jgi:hypothetical protein
MSAPILPIRTSISQSIHIFDNREVTYYDGSCQPKPPNPLVDPPDPGCESPNHPHQEQTSPRDRKSHFLGAYPGGETYNEHTPLQRH